MGQLAEGCGVCVEVWLPHHKMAASGTTSPRMQQHPTRCRCLRHLMDKGAFKTGGACCERASHESRKSQEGEQRALEVRVKLLWKRLLKRLLKAHPEGGRLALSREGPGRRNFKLQLQWAGCK